MRRARGPFRLAWEELPAEWVDSAWFRHVRVFSVGPFAQLSACLRLEPDGTCGCIGRYTLEVSPRTRFGALLLRSGFFPAVERSFTRLAETALAWAKGLRTQPFDTAPVDPGDRHRPRIAAAVARIEALGNGHGLAARLAAWLLAAQQLDVIRFRPLALAAAWGIEGRLVVELCLQAAREGGSSTCNGICSARALPRRQDRGGVARPAAGRGALRNLQHPLRP